VNSKQLKLVAAGVGASAAVVMGALGVTFASTPESTGTFSEGPEITLGETSTEEAAPTEVATTFVTPPVTAEKPDGFDMG
jgi:hypothetical protein